MQNRTEKQIMPFKTTVNWLFNDTWCYLVIAFFDWKIGIFQQTVARVSCILNCKAFFLHMFYKLTQTLKYLLWGFLLVLKQSSFSRDRSGKKFSYQGLLFLAAFVCFSWFENSRSWIALTLDVLYRQSCSQAVHKPFHILGKGCWKRSN